MPASLVASLGQRKLTSGFSSEHARLAYDVSGLFTAALLVVHVVLKIRY